MFDQFCIVKYADGKLFFEMFYTNILESIMRVADCAEVLLYMMIDMLGLLSWRGLNNHRVGNF